jgi:signal transduction histidine kinase
MNDYYTLWVHQIKTPISALQLLLEAHPSEHTLSMKTELFKIEQYVEMALNYIRLESETSDLRFERQDIYELVKGSIRKYRTLFIEKGIKLNFEPFSLEVVTDAKWFAFCFEQVLSNALKYTNGGEITIGTANGNDSDDSKRLVVADTGIGISPEDLPRVFERGFTGFNGRLDRKSTGLGLYLCKRALPRYRHHLGTWGGHACDVHLSTLQNCKLTQRNVSQFDGDAFLFLI